VVRRSRKSLLLIAPASLFLVALFLVPVVRVLAWSLVAKDKGGITFDNYVHLFTQPVYVQVIVNTLTVSLMVTAVALVLGYPLAYVLARVPDRIGQILLVFVLLPFWTSVLVRTYAWSVIFQRNGPLNGLLLAIGAANTPLPMGHSRFGVIVGISQILLPLMVLPLYSVIRGIDTNLTRAAQSLGAGPFLAFRRVLLPLSIPGIAAGCLMVFVLSIGSFITPALLGGGRETFVAQLIEQQTNALLNWNLAAALAVLLLIVSTALILVVGRFFGLGNIWQRT
jgi:putative spermidine/putrescine transport system permease protein